MRKYVQVVSEREFCIDNLLVRIHFIIAMIWWTGLTPWEFEFPFPGSLTSTFLTGAKGAVAVGLARLVGRHIAPLRRPGAEMESERGRERARE